MSREVTPILTAQDCIVAMMMAIAISDSNIRTAELVKIQSAVNNLPIFAEYDIDRLNIISQTVFDLFEQEDGLDALFGLVRNHLPTELNETVYALCCDVAAADGLIFEPAGLFLSAITTCFSFAKTSTKQASTKIRKDNGSPDFSVKSPF